MIKMYTAFTDEVDDAEDAIDDILSQINLDTLQTNSVGLIYSSHEAVNTGVISSICKMLPFETVGCTTLAGGTNGRSGSIGICVSILTGDDVYFATATSESLSDKLDDIASPVKNAFEMIRSKVSEDPVVFIALSPLITQIGGESISDALYANCGNAMVFGTLCSDSTDDFSESYTFINGEITKNSVQILGIYGNVKARFAVKVFSDEKVQRQKATITKSEGSKLLEVNDKPLMQYLETLGLARNNGIENISVVPFIIGGKDGSPAVARAIYFITPEGYAVCGGRMPEGSSFAVGTLDTEDIFATAKAGVSELMSEEASALLFFPCLSRNLVLGFDVTAEIDLVCNEIGGQIPYTICYSGGESCPMQSTNGELVNCFHNFTFIGCALFN